ncbi:MAG TPA: alpha/beta hydrolase [Steroidobacteraceae bacterium]|nr:alpha/beta hydrolase [Steroidobacteraceae bacterium]
MALMPLELSFRTADAGGDINTAPDLSQFLQLSHRELILFVHGFNNTVSQARDAYAGFMANQQLLACVPTGGDFAPGQQIVEIFWKGDDWGVMSALYYADAVPNSVITGRALGQVLQALAVGRGESLEVSIVAHSLGTRLALECLKEIGATPAVLVNHIVFFAAATATFMLDSEAEVHGLRRPLNSVSGGSVSLYSGADMVLALAFPPGQTFSHGQEGFFPTALGHAEWETPTPPPLLNQAENTGAGHSDYWGWSHKHPKCEARASKYARDTLELPFIGSRDLTSRDMTARDASDARGLQLRDVADRATSSRPQ